MAKTKTQEMAAAKNLERISVRFVTPHEDVKIAVWATPQEWMELREVLHEDPLGGYLGNYFVIPKGVQVTALARDPT